MTALAAPADRQVQPNTTSTKSRQPLAASARPFQGSVLSLKTDGYVRTLTDGDVVLGLAERTTDTEDVSATDGGCHANVDRGIQTVVVPLTGVARDDVGHRRMVYATDDGTFTFTPNGSPIGAVIGVYATNLAVVQMIPHHFVTPGPGALGIVTLGDVAATLTTAHLDKVLLIANTAARTLTLPAAADCAGRFLTVKKTSAAAFAVTLDGNGAETIDGAATFAAQDAAYDTVTMLSDGTAWHIIAKMIA
jgi:hypothetical protein